MQETKKTKTNLTPKTHPELIPDPDELLNEPSISDILSSVIEEKGISLNTRKRPLLRESLDESDNDSTSPETEGSTFKRRFAPALFVLFFVSALIIVIHALGLHFYSMHTRSMERVIPVGSLVVSTSVPTYTLMEGDVITFRNSLGILITHQIYDILPNQQGDHTPSFITKGTENPTPDREVIHSDQVVGRVLFHIPRLGGYLMFFRGVFSGG